MVPEGERAACALAPPGSTQGAGASIRGWRAPNEGWSPEIALAQLLVEHPDAIVVIDSHGEVVWANATAERVFGRSLGVDDEPSALDYVHPDDLELVLRSIVSVQRKEVGTAIEIRIMTPSGWRLFEIIGTNAPWLGQGAILLSLRDLTERRRFELARGHDERSRSIVHNSASVTMLVDVDGRIDSVSGAFTRVLGHDPEDLEGSPLAAIVLEADRPLLGSLISSALRGATSVQPVSARIHLVGLGDRGAIPFELRIVNLTDDPTVRGLVISAHDATEQVQAESKLLEALSLLRATLDSTADGILVVDATGKITSYNRRFAEMWRIPVAQLEERDDASAIAYVLDQLSHPELFIAKVEELYARPEAHSHDTLEFKDGRVFERYSMPQPVAGEIVGRVWSFSDVTDRKRLEDELSYQAFHDSLTGIANKALFQNRLDHAAARLAHTGSKLAVLFVDLDDFKTVNDSLGHSEGDRLLKQVADTVVGCLRSIDTAARLGGDEFAILLEDVGNHAAVLEVAERILGALRTPVRLSGNAVTPTASIGIAFGTEGTTSEQMLRNADIAMYTAKEKGKDCYEEFQDEMHTAVLARLELETELRIALEEDQLVVHYQPIIDLSSGEICGLEALVRWASPDRGLLTPQSFVPLAEEMGVIDAVDGFVLRTACSQVRAWRDEGLCGPDFMVNVNLSARQLAHPYLSERVLESVSESGLDPSKLVLEITESAVMTDNETAVENLLTLRALGVRIALDDFGTGYSSLARLDLLPIDILKVDQSFVRALDGGYGASELASAIVKLAQTLGYVTIAEGVESVAQAMRLHRLGCQLAQGFYLGHPVDAGATHELLCSRRGAAGVPSALSFALKVSTLN